MSIVVGPPGVLVAVEGIDGAGKTTQVERLTELFTREGYSVVRTKEPTDGPWGRKLRESATTGRLSPEDELDTFLRDRREHVADRRDDGRQGVPVDSGPHRDGRRHRVAHAAPARGLPPREAACRE